MQVFLVQTLWPTRGKSCPPVMQNAFSVPVASSMGADGGQDCVPQGTGSLQHFVPAHPLWGWKPVPGILSCKEPQPELNKSQFTAHAGDALSETS